MTRWSGLLLGCAVLLASWAPTATADPPRPGTTDSGLNESEEATLWSKQPADGFITNDEYRAAYGENRTTIHELANGTDLTFTRPPSTAKRWTRYAHGTYTPGGTNTSVYPPHAETADSMFVKDAHATTFAVSPATKAHVEPDDERFYVRPTGRFMGTIDYRVEAPPTKRTDTTEVQWVVLDHEIAEVRLYADDDLIDVTSNTHRPDFAYELDADVDTLRIEADIEATVEKTVLKEKDDGTLSEAGSFGIGDSVTVSDTVDVEVYDFQATTQQVEYPSGEQGLMIFQTDPWQGYTLTADESVSVRGTWRFFTARETDWDEFVHATGDGSERVDSDTLPVYVHAYPSRLGPVAKPEYDGPTIIRTWGESRETPAGALPDGVAVEVVKSPYEPTRGIAVRSRHADPNQVTVHGIVYGTRAEVTEFVDGPQRIRETDLSATIVAQNESGATVRLELTDAETGDPIDLDGPPADADNSSEGGYIEIDGKRVTTDESGQAVVVLSQPGTYTARYEPQSWLDSSPPYAGASTVVRWHPLTTVAGWLNLFVRAGVALLPFAVAWYAGRRLSTFLEWRRF